jgi:Tannase and feruloyl esterase
MIDPIRHSRTLSLVAAVSLLVAGCAEDESGAAGTAGASAAPAAQPTANAATPVSTCGRLIGLALDGVTIDTAEPLEAAVRQVATGPIPQSVTIDVPHCRVAGVIDSTIGFELLMPDDWNGKFLMGGGGGFVGAIQNSAQDGQPSGSTALERGYATAGTDTGHRAGGIDATWALNNQKAKEDFGYRAVHRTAEVSKAIVADYYADAIDYSYFFGCSRGGGQALVEAQRYPLDFDGIIAGAPAMDWPNGGAGMIQNQQAVFPDSSDLSSPVITGDNRSLLARSILAQCDTLDGVADGILTDPRVCPFDPADLPRCDGAPGPECLTDAQLAAIETIYRGPVVNGESIHPGFPFGGETVGWPNWITKLEGPAAALLPPDLPNAQYGFGTQLFKNFLYSDPDWVYDDYTFDDFAEVAPAVAALLNSTNPDLSAFDAAGGRLILWHGWSDAALTPLDSIDYYEAAAALDPDVDDHFRLFLLPGVAHCAGGPGPDQADWISAIERWVEGGVAPERVIASKLAAGATTMQRPLCRYPEQAVYDGSGDPNVAASFACEVPAD